MYYLSIYFIYLSYTIHTCQIRMCIIIKYTSVIQAWFTLRRQWSKGRDPIIQNTHTQVVYICIYIYPERTHAGHIALITTSAKRNSKLPLSYMYINIYTSTYNFYFFLSILYFFFPFKNSTFFLSLIVIIAVVTWPKTTLMWIIIHIPIATKPPMRTNGGARQKKKKLYTSCVTHFIILWSLVKLLLIYLSIYLFI